jgi:hypothetical protein
LPNLPSAGDLLAHIIVVYGVETFHPKTVRPVVCPSVLLASGIGFPPIAGTAQKAGEIEVARLKRALCACDRLYYRSSS